jgi:uncharacterized protein with beta-barrel porin domain
MAAARALLDELTPTRRAARAAPPGPLRRAVLAARLAEAFDVLSADAVAEARTGDEPVTWAQVGQAFGIRTQSAQERFGRARSQLDT